LELQDFQEAHAFSNLKKLNQKSGNHKRKGYTMTLPSLWMGMSSIFNIFGDEFGNVKGMVSAQARLESTWRKPWKCDQFH
jgi:hypothetical protein